MATKTVSFPVDLGGSGTTYRNDADANGMAANGGYGYKDTLFDMLGEAVDVADGVKTNAEAAAADRAVVEAVAGNFGDAAAAVDAAETARDEAVAARADSETAKDMAEEYRDAALAASVVAEAARDSVNTTGKVFSDTTAGLAGTSNGQSFSVVAGDGLSYIVYKNNAGVALELTRAYTKIYFDQVVQAIASTSFPYLIPFVALDEDGAERLLGGFDLDGQFDLGGVADIGGKVAALADQILAGEADAERSGWLLPFVADDVDGVVRVLGGFDQDGRLQAGKRPVVVDTDYSFEYISPRDAFVCWGDSLTEGSGGTPYPEQLASLLGKSVVNAGYGGQNAAQILARQGAHCATVTVSGNQIPASGAVSVTMSLSILGYPTSATKSITGAIDTLSGPIAGTLTKDASANYTFTRTVSGAAATVLPNTPFMADTNDYDYGVNILWAGTNDVGTSGIADVPAYVDLFVESIKTVEKRFLILGPVNDAAYTSVTGAYTAMRAAIESLKQRYPRNFIDVQERLVYSYDSGNPQDVADFGNKVLPTSLRNDTIHLNTDGYALVAGWVHEFLNWKGWL